MGGAVLESVLSGGPESYSRLNSATDGMILRSPSLFVLCVPPHLSDSIYLSLRSLIPSLVNFAQGRAVKLIHHQVCTSNETKDRLLCYAALLWH